MNENFDKFDEYVMKFDMDDDGIKYKYNHSYRVVHQAEEICRSLNTDTVERDLASLIALLHDIARFRQWEKYKTFNDRTTIDHGDEAVKILFDEGEIKNYICDKEDYDVIKKAIENHNKKSVDYDNMNDREKLHTKIIRDADKLDIIYSMAMGMFFDFREDKDKGISDKIAEDFFNHKICSRADIQNKNDNILVDISMIYDLNLDYSKERVVNERYLERIYEHIKNKKMFKKYIDEMIKYLKGGK